jgi:hypothetical protein
MGEPFIKLPKAMLARVDLLLIDKVILAYLIDKIGNNGHCWPGGRTIADDIGTDKSTVFRSIDRLAASGEIRISRGGRGKSSTYEVSAKCGQSDAEQCPQNADSQVSAKCDGVSAECGHLCPQNADIKDRPNKRPKKKTQAHAPLPDIPFELETPEFRELWTQFVQHRIEIKHRMTPTAAKRLLDKLVRWGADRAAAATRYSLENGWQGIFEEKLHGKAKTPDDERDVLAEYLAEHLPRKESEE